MIGDVKCVDQVITDDYAIIRALAVMLSAPLPAIALVLAFIVRHLRGFISSPISTAIYRTTMGRNSGSIMHS